MSVYLSGCLLLQLRLLHEVCLQGQGRLVPGVRAARLLNRPATSDRPALMRPPGATMHLEPSTSGELGCRAGSRLIRSSSLGLPHHPKQHARQQPLARAHSLGFDQQAGGSRTGNKSLRLPAAMAEPVIEEAELELLLDMPADDDGHLDMLEQMNAKLAAQLDTLGVTDYLTEEDRLRLEQAQKQHVSDIAQGRLKRRLQRATKRQSADDTAALTAPAVAEPAEDEALQGGKAADPAPAQRPIHWQAQQPAAGAKNRIVRSTRRRRDTQAAAPGQVKRHSSWHPLHPVGRTTTPSWKLPTDRQSASNEEAAAPQSASGARAARAARLHSKSPEPMDLPEFVDREGLTPSANPIATVPKIFQNNQGSKNNNLLTAKQEHDLAFTMSKARPFLDVKTELAKTLQREPTLLEWATAAGQEGDLIAFDSVIAAAKEARDTMIWANERLVISVARRYANRGVDLEDLIAEGMTGLGKGVDRYDYSKGFRFSTYAHWWIRQAISRSLLEQQKVVRLPVHVYEQMTKINKAREELMDTLRREPTLIEISEHVHISTARIGVVLQAHQAQRDLDAPLHGTGSETLGQTITDDGPTPEEVSEYCFMVRDMENVLFTLSPREVAVLRMRYGMDDGVEKTLEDVGAALGVTRERIRQIENKAVRKLRDPARGSALQAWSNTEFSAPADVYSTLKY